MERLAAYLTSTGIFAFGLWTVASAPFKWDSVMIWLVVAMAPIAVGIASLANEIDNDRHG
jgi:hypothetical protein